MVVVGGESVSFTQESSAGPPSQQLSAPLYASGFAAALTCFFPVGATPGEGREGKSPSGNEPGGWGVAASAPGTLTLLLRDGGATLWNELRDLTAVFAPSARTLKPLQSRTHAEAASGLSSEHFLRAVERLLGGLRLLGCCAPGPRDTSFSSRLIRARELIYHSVLRIRRLIFLIPPPPPLSTPSIIPSLVFVGVFFFFFKTVNASSSGSFKATAASQRRVRYPSVFWRQARAVTPEYSTRRAER